MRERAESRIGEGACMRVCEWQEEKERKRENDERKKREDENVLDDALHESHVGDLPRWKPRSGEGGRIFRVEFFFPSSCRENARFRENPLALVPHFDRTRRVAFDYRDRPCGRQVSWTVAWWSVALKSRCWFRFERWRYLRFFSRLAMILKRHPVSVFPFEFYATSSLSFEFVSIRAFSLYLLHSCSSFHSFRFPVIGFLWFSYPFFFFYRRNLFVEDCARFYS